MSTSLSDHKSYISKALMVTNTVSAIVTVFSAEFLAIILLFRLIEPSSTTIFGVSIDDPLLPVPALLAFVVCLMIATVTAASLRSRDIPYFGMTKQSDVITHHTLVVTSKHD